MPFSEPWFYGIQVGNTVQVTGTEAGIHTCQVSNTTIQVSIAGHNIFLAVNDSAFQSSNITDMMLESILIIIFTVTGISIFLRATNRPVAHVTYGLFYCVSLIFAVMGAELTNHPWINILLFVLLMIGRGLSTTFVCILPLAASHREGEKRVSVLPYVPLIVALALIVVPFPLLLLWPQMRIVYILLTLIFNFACLVVVVWMLFRGLRHLSRDEKRITQMIVVGSLFLLLPLALSISIIGTNNIVQPDLVRLLSVPLTALPIIYSYILFRPRLVGITSLLSRQAMRVLLWLLLASLFVFPIVILLRFVSANVTNGTEMRVYIFAILLVISLWLFPLVWSKVRDMGDSVFYRDFYQYNQSLSDLSTALTRLQGLDQISAFILPRLAQLLNVTDVALLVHGMQREHIISNTEDGST
ncbi:MAG TPA: hypothetical protein VKR42_09585, partial [Ktedonobacteraceae bacterium]|nr:hypothetical protein [Ktedonobacteraceae bacterium]